MVQEGALQGDVAAHRALKDLDFKDLLIVVPLCAQYANLVLVNLSKGFVDDGGLVISCQTYISAQILPLLVVLGSNILALPVIDGSVLLLEEDLVLYDENIFNHRLSLLLLVFSLPLDHGQVVQDNLAEVMCILFLKQLDLPMDQSQQIVVVQVK
jgi:hypothetical protein